MSQRTLGLIMNGVSGRMGVNQHLIRSVAAIRAQGGVLMSDGSRVMLDPVLVSRTGEKVKALAEQHGGLRWTTDLDAEIASPRNHIFFDTATTQMRPNAPGEGDQRRQAHLLREADRHQPRRGAEDLPAGQAERHQERHGAGQAVPARPAEDQAAARLGLLRPYLLGARRVRLLGVRGRLGRPAQRPSWNYRTEDGGGIVLDMVCHWRYVLDNLFGKVSRCRASPPPTFPNGSTRRASATPRPPTTRPMPHSSSKAASSPTST
jgi:hypothetical protein